MHKTLRVHHWMARRNAFRFQGSPDMSHEILARREKQQDPRCPRYAAQLLRGEHHTLRFINTPLVMCNTAPLFPKYKRKDPRRQLPPPTITAAAPRVLCWLTVGQQEISFARTLSSDSGLGPGVCGTVYKLVATTVSFRLHRAFKHTRWSSHLLGNTCSGASVIF
jgi:hypothetical protein